MGSGWGPSGLQGECSPQFAVQSLPIYMTRTFNSFANACSGISTEWPLCPCRYVGIANLKMRPLESSMLQLWKQHVGADFNFFAALSAAPPVKSLQGRYSLCFTDRCHRLQKGPSGNSISDSIAITLA